MSYRFHDVSLYVKLIAHLALHSINLPQTAVLGIHSIKERAVVVNGQIVIRPIMIVALTYDHRLLDGRESVTMLGESSPPAVGYIRHPATVLIEV